VLTKCSKSCYELRKKQQDENPVSSEAVIPENTCPNGGCGADLPKLPKLANEQGKPIEVNPNECRDRRPDCPQFQQAGECEKNPGLFFIF
jgi:hypothetical protein